ncbi:MAG: N-acetylmuramoyl-L-alanine amidase [Gammaproteobacteria bacterium]|nr:N-acetylmuramoyl-L-alanine amidase [Gammaproteobacteria bacterium]
MRVLRHRLQMDGNAVPFAQSPNVGGVLEPKYLVIHFTAGSSAQGSINWLRNRAARASAHLVIARNGEVTQLVPFNRVAWHAGASEWEGLRGMNRHSIGIELDNGGRLERKGNRWCSWFSAVYPEEEVMLASHRHETEACGWHVYTSEQLEMTMEVCQVIIGKYGLHGIAGHDEIAPGRKSDPGPAFPMANFRARLFGRAEDDFPVFRTRTALNIRTGAGIEYERLPDSPLQPDTRVEVLEEGDVWRFVNVLNMDPHHGEIQGWVHGKYLERVE